MLIPWKESYDHLDSILKSRDITLPTKVYLVKAMVFPETAAHQAPLSLGFSRQEHWSGLPFRSLMHSITTCLQRNKRIKWEVLFPSSIHTHPLWITVVEGIYFLAFSLSQPKFNQLGVGLSVFYSTSPMILAGCLRLLTLFYFGLLS